MKSSAWSNGRPLSELLAGMKGHSVCPELNHLPLVKLTKPGLAYFLHDQHRNTKKTALCVKGFRRYLKHDLLVDASQMSVGCKHTTHHKQNCHLFTACTRFITIRSWHAALNLDVVAHKSQVLGQKQSAGFGSDSCSVCMFVCVCVQTVQPYLLKISHCHACSLQPHSSPQLLKVSRYHSIKKPPAQPLQNCPEL